MDWIDYEFIADVPPETDPERPGDLTGWESVIFELDDEAGLEDEGDNLSSRLRSG